MAKDIKKHVKGLGIEPVAATGVTQAGEMEVLSTNDNKLQYHNGTDASPVVTESHEATLTNKTINSDNNTLDLEISVLRADNSNPDRAIKRDNNGIIISGNIIPDDTELVTIDAVQTLTNKEMSGLDNTFFNIPENALQTIAGDANKVLKRDGSGNVTSQFLTSADVGLGNVDNTSDLDKPISTATQAALDDKANITLNNLGTTSINADLIPQANIDLGSPTNQFAQVNATVLQSAGPLDIKSGTDSILMSTDAQSGNTSAIAINTGTSTTAQSGNVGLGTGGTLGTGDSGDVSVFTGQVLNAAASSGDITVATGTTITPANRGNVVLDGREIIASNKQIKQVANPTDDTDAVNLQTLQEEITKSGGDINFLALSGVSFNGENGTTGIATYQDAAASRPVDGIGGTPTVSVSTLAFGALSGSNSLIFTKPNSNVQGQGFSIDFSIDRANQARVLKVEFDYNVAAGTFVAGTTSTDSDIIVYLYDVTNNRLIEPSTFRLFSNSTTVADKFSGYFQTSSDSLNYRLIFHVTTTSAVAFDLRVDNIIVTPSKQIFGSVITDWQSYTPTITSGAGSILATIEGRWRRVGDSAEIRIDYVYTSGTGAAANLAISLPTGQSIDNSKRTSFQTLGSGYFFRTSTGFLGTEIRRSTDTSVQFSLNGANGFILGTDADDAGAGISVAFQVPIQGWSSSVQMSSEVIWVDDVGKVDAFAVPHTSPPQGYLFCNGAAVSRSVYAELFQKIGTTHGSGDGSTTFNLPDYRGRFLRGQSAGTGRDPDAASRTALNPGGLTGDNVGTFQSFLIQSHNHEEGLKTAIVNDLPYQYGTVARSGNGVGGFAAQTALRSGLTSPVGGSETRPVNVNVNYFIKFTRHAAPVLAQSEVVAFRATRIAGNVTLNNTTQDFIFNNVQIDTFGSYNNSTGIYTFANSGLYEITSSIASFSNTATGGSGLVIQADTGSGFSDRNLGFIPHFSTNNQYKTPVASFMARFNSGHRVKIRAATNVASDVTFIGDNGAWNYFLIKKIG